jgi:hypothetical protein
VNNALVDSCYGRARTQSFISARRIGQIFVALISFEHFVHIRNAIADKVNKSGQVVHLPVTFNSGVSLKEMAPQF